VFPQDSLLSLKAFKATGFWNQLYKVGHFFYLVRCFIPFMYYARPAVASPKVNNFFKALRKDEAKDLPVGAAGFCWGGHFVTHLCWDQAKTDDGKRLIDCGFVAHPSFLKFPGDIEMVALPYSCAASEHDNQMSPENAKQTREILSAKTAKTKDQGIEHEFVLYEGAHHGFAVSFGEASSHSLSVGLTRSQVRADEGDKEEAEAGKKAEDQAVKWFERWFAHPPP